MQLILYSKPGCCLCEGLQAKLQQLTLELEVRDITTSEVWWAKYEYEVPVLSYLSKEGETFLPRPSPRSSVNDLEKMLQKYVTKY